MKTKDRLSIFHTIFLIGITISGCGGPPPTAPSPAPEADVPSVALAPEGEPGQPLTIRGTVLDRATNEPIPGASLYLYQTDSSGEYLPSDPDDNATARLSGEVATGETGQFVVHTVLPGEYDRPGTRHIHLHYARAEGYEEINRTLLFEDNASEEMRQWAEETGLGILLELTEQNGVLEANLIIPLDPE
jgi:protocatechuate 3,4-dioxygenase beta subunit